MSEEKLQPLEGDDYWNLMRNTAERVKDWPEWNRGEKSERIPDLGRDCENEPVQELNSLRDELAQTKAELQQEKGQREKCVEKLGDLAEALHGKEEELQRAQTNMELSRNYSKDLEADNKNLHAEVAKLTGELQRAQSELLRIGLATFGPGFDTTPEKIIAEIARLRESDANGKRYKAELDMIARAVYPHKEGGFTYSALFICDEISDMRDKLYRMRRGIATFLAVVDQSEGVVGYHLNGNLATWDEFEEITEMRTLSLDPSKPGSKQPEGNAE